MKVVFTCAGTGGHINPALAIAKYIKKKDENSEILFIGTFDGLENNLVSNAGFNIKHIRTGKLIRSLTLKNFSQMYNVVCGIKDAKEILKEFKPDLVIGTGGYICIPVMRAAKVLKIPYMLHESNAFPGVSVKLLARKASKVFIAFDDAKKRLNNLDNIVLAGTPTKFSKEEYLALNSDECKKELNIKDDKKILFVTGGSQGARVFIDIILGYVRKYRRDDLYIIFVTGEKNYDEVLSKKKDIENEENINLDKYLRVEKFVFDMDKMYKVADCCMTRSGAMTVTELSLVEKPSILIPFPYAAENHQYYNAKVLEDAGIGIIIEEKYLDLEKLNSSINELLFNDKRSKEIKSVYKSGVEEIIYKNILDVLKD